MVNRRTVFIYTLLKKYHVFQITGIAVAIIAIFTFAALLKSRQSITSSASTTVDITFDGSSYFPDDVTIQEGDTVRWTNTSSTYTQISSDPHPIHTNYPALNVGLLASGDSITLIFPTSGTYGYHDHLLPSATGTINVVAIQTATPTDAPTDTPIPITVTHTPTPSITNTRTPTPKPTATDTPFETFDEFSRRITIVPTDTPTITPTKKPIVLETPVDTKGKSILVPLTVGAIGLTIIVLCLLLYLRKRHRSSL